MARGINLGRRSRVDPAGKLPRLQRPSTRVRIKRGHRHNNGRKGR